MAVSIVVTGLPPAPGIPSAATALGETSSADPAPFNASAASAIPPIKRVQFTSTGTETDCPLAPGRTGLLFQPVTAGNLLVVVASAYGGGPLNLRVENPSGFTKLDGSPAGDQEAAIFYKIADGTESLINVLTDGSVQRINFWAGEYSGVDPTNPVDVWTVNANGGCCSSYTGATDEPSYMNGLYLYAFGLFNESSGIAPVRLAATHGGGFVDDAHCRPSSKSTHTPRTVVYDRFGGGGEQDAAHGHLYFGSSAVKNVRMWAVVFRAADASLSEALAQAGGTSNVGQVRGAVGNSVSSRSAVWDPSPIAGRTLIASARTIAQVPGVSHTSPPGWTQVGGTDEVRYASALDQYVVDTVWTKIATGTETTDTWTFSQSVSIGQLIAAEYSGVGDLNARKYFDAHDAHYGGSSGNAAEATTPRGRTDANKLNLAFLSTDDLTGPVSMLTNGWVEDGVINGGNFGKMFLLRKNTSAKGDLVTRATFSYGASTRVGGLIAFGIVAAEGPAIPVWQTYGTGIHAENPTGFFADPVNSATGAFTTSNTDVSLPGVGLPFAFTRSYTSADPTEGSLGVGWNHSYAPSLHFLSNGDAVLRGEDGQQVHYTLKPDGSFNGGTGSRSKLTAVSGGHELTRTDQVVYEFDSAGLLASLRDRNGNSLALTHDSAGNLETLTDTAGRLITFSHGAGGRLAAISLPDGRSVSYGYTDGRLTSVTDLRGGTTTYAYDAEGRMIRITDQLGHNNIENLYGVDGRVIQQTDAMGEISTFSWDATTQAATMTDARGKPWRDVYEGNVLVGRADPLGNETSFGYDSDLNRSTVTDPRGNTTTMSHDARGNLLARTAPAPLSHQEEFTYDAGNNVLTAKDGRGNTTSFEYDSRGNLIKTTQPGAVVTEFGRDPVTGQLTSTTDPRGKTTSFTYDSSGNLDEVTTPLGNRTTFAQDSAGRVISMVDPRGNVAGANPNDFKWQFTYDTAGNLRTETDPLANVTEWTYDPAGNVTVGSDANNHTISYAYNAADELTSVSAPGAIDTSYGYDQSGNLISRTDDNNHTTVYEYDDSGRLSATVDPLGNRWTYGYDAAGNLASVTDAEGNFTPAPGDGTSTFSFDALNRPTGVDYSGLTPDVAWAYDANSNPTQMTDGLGTETYGYDALNRLSPVTRGSDTFSYAFDAAGNLTQRTYPDGTVVDLAYDDDGRLSSLTSAGKTTTYTYDSAGNVTKVTYPNGTEETRVYDPAARVTEVTHKKGPDILARFNYTLDSVGNPTRVDSPSETITYQYDPLDRLTEACYQAGCTLPVDPFIRYTYDGVGNRLVEAHPTGTTTYAYDAGDRLLSATGLLGTTAFTYDRNGNQTSAGSMSFSWNQQGLLASTTQGTDTTSYDYDGWGKRLRANKGSDVTSFTWDVGRPLPELALERDGSGGLKRRYLYGRDLIQMTTGGSDYTYHHDAVGSTAALTSGTGDKTASYLYEPFGSERQVLPPNPPTPDNRMRFTGEYLDRTGLYHLRARQYDPVASGFLSLDPFPGIAKEPYASSYVYALNRPTMLVDPTGLRGQEVGCPSIISPTIPAPQPPLPTPNPTPQIPPPSQEDFVGTDWGCVYSCIVSQISRSAAISGVSVACVFAIGVCARTGHPATCLAATLCVAGGVAFGSDRVNSCIQRCPEKVG